MDTQDDALALELILLLEQGMQVLKRAQSDPASLLDKQALAVAATQLETAMLWVANSRP